MRPLQLSTKHGRSPGPLRAFTLIELVAILVIVAIMAGVAVPTLGNITGTRASVAARQPSRTTTRACGTASRWRALGFIGMGFAAPTWRADAGHSSMRGMRSPICLRTYAVGGRRCLDGRRLRRIP